MLYPPIYTQSVVYKSADFEEDETSVKILKLLKKNKETIKESHLFQSLTAASAPFIAELFDGQQIVWTKESALNCLFRVQSRQEELIWETLKKSGWPFKSLVNEENKGILTVAIEERNLKLVQWLLSQENFSIQEMDKEAAWECGDLEIIECLIDPEYIIDRWAQQPNLFLELFQNYFFFSKLEKIQDYCSRFAKRFPSQNLCHLYQNTFNNTALIARCTKNKERSHLATLYEIDLEKYVQNQMEFGTKCHQVINKKLQELKGMKLSLFSLLEDFAKVRYEIAKARQDKDYESYIQLRSTLPGPSSFIAYQEVEKDLVFKGFSSHTPFGSFYWQPSRYCFAIPWMKQTMKHIYSEEIDRSDMSYGYIIYYNDSKTLKKYPLTQVHLDKQFWVHTAPEVIPELWPVLETMHDTLLTMNLDLSNPVQVEEFQKKIAHAYWLGCHLMLTKRGNAQYFLMWMSTLLHYHGFDPLLPKRETPMPDCLAISLPLSVFIDIFPSIFENPLFIEGRIQKKYDVNCASAGIREPGNPLL